MNKDAKKFIKESGLLIKNITYIDEPITTHSEYNKLYEPSGGSASGGGFCIFYHNDGNQKKGTMYPMSEKLNNEIFKVEP